MGKEMKALTRELKLQVTILGSIVALMWGLEILDTFVFAGWLNRYGILPRTVIGLRGILFAPLLHGGFGHLAANTVPFLTLGWLVMLRETSDFWIVTALTMLIGGLGTWLVGAPAFHIGASGLVFGYLGFLLLRGYFERNVLSVIFSVIVGLLYGGLLWGLLPAQPGISWEGHLFGFLGGVVAARWMAKPRPQRD